MDGEQGERKMDDAREKDLERKLLEICEHCERTGDWEPVRKIEAILKEGRA
jgi:hypothetical protein